MVDFKVNFRLLNRCLNWFSQSVCTGLDSLTPLDILLTKVGPEASNWSGATYYMG